MTTQSNATNSTATGLANPAPEILPKILQIAESADGHSKTAEIAAIRAANNAADILQLLKTPPAGSDPLDLMMNLLTRVASELTSIREQQAQILERLPPPPDKGRF